MKKLFTAVLLTTAILCAGCGGDKKLASDGKTITVDLPEGEKLVNFASSYYAEYVVHRKRRADEKPEDYTVDKINLDGFGGHEQTNGRYIIHEH